MPGADIFGSSASSPRAFPYPREPVDAPRAQATPAGRSKSPSPKDADDDESVAFVGGGGPAASSTDPPTDTFGAGATVSLMAPVNIADITWLIPQVRSQVNPLGVAQQVAEEAARSSQNDARWQELQPRMLPIEGGPIVSGGPGSGLGRALRPYTWQGVYVLDRLLGLRPASFGRPQRPVAPRLRRRLLRHPGLAAPACGRARRSLRPLVRPLCHTEAQGVVGLNLAPRQAAAAIIRRAPRGQRAPWVLGEAVGLSPTATHPSSSLTRLVVRLPLLCSRPPRPPHRAPGAGL